MNLSVSGAGKDYPTKECKQEFQYTLHTFTCVSGLKNGSVGEQRLTTGLQGCVVHRGIKTVGREPSWCMLNSEYHKALAPFFLPS